MSNAELVATIAHILDPWAFETKSYNATIARDDATDKATQIVEALAALDSRAGDAGEAISALRALLVIAGTPITERQEAVFRRANAIAFPTPAPAVDALSGGKLGWDADGMCDDHGAFACPKCALPSTVDAVPAGEVSDMAWFGDQHRLSLSHYSPMYGDDDDQSVEWRVMRESGPIDDREWDIVGRGETPYEAVASARAALSHGEGRK